MDSKKFADILASLKEMDGSQKFSLFHSIEEDLDMIIPFYTSRANIDENLDEFEMEPLTDEEWATISKEIETEQEHAQSLLLEVEVEAIRNVRSDYME